ncbi:hypothetical protein, partial [Streptomyces sp. AS02]|uniref:hypothetical protein n=1 Tax=Streptomyces sp. AS02 TaxID=2938946 RepID=UPI002020B5B4
ELSFYVPTHVPATAYDPEEYIFSDNREGFFDELIDLGFTMPGADIFLESFDNGNGFIHG